MKAGCSKVDHITLFLPSPDFWDTVSSPRWGEAHVSTGDLCQGAKGAAVGVGTAGH